MNSHVKIAFETLDRLSHFGCAVGICFANGHPRYPHFTYSSDFLEKYHDLELALKDATILYGFQNNGVVRWAQLERDGWPTDAFELSKSHGIEDGFCFALEVEGRKTIASVSRRADFPLSKAEIDECMDALTLATLSAAQELQGIPYSDRTMEFLELAAKGADDKEVADCLGLTIHGARNRRKTALKEVGAKTVAQAVVMAIRSGALSPYQSV